jgi:hypothetical protein
VDVACRKKDRLARFEHYEVQQESEDASDVTRIELPEPGSPPELPLKRPGLFRQAAARSHDGLDQVRPLDTVLQELAHDAAKSVLVGFVAKLRAEEIERGHAEPSQELDRPRRLSKPGERFESRERAEKLRLVTSIAIAAARRGHGDASTIIGFIAADGLLGGGMSLDRQGRLRRQHLEQKRQAIAECPARAPVGSSAMTSRSVLVLPARRDGATG